MVRKQLSTPAVSSENKPKKGYVRKTMAQSARFLKLFLSAEWFGNVYVN
jgi:hypothetical protein